MSDCRWTPGPWVIGDENNSSVEVCIGDVLASIDREGPHFNEMKITRDEMRANAYLISAAPELYEALFCIDFDDGMIAEALGEDLQYKIHAALAKARGDS